MELKTIIEIDLNRPACLMAADLCGDILKVVNLEGLEVSQVEHITWLMREHLTSALNSLEAARADAEYNRLWAEILEPEGAAL